MEQKIKDINGQYTNIENVENNISSVDIKEQSYIKFKYLIENSIKLYADFWEIFTTSITSIVNTSKLYSIGGKLNIYLKEISNLWNYEIKNRKINLDYQNIVILYSRFLSEI